MEQGGSYFEYKFNLPLETGFRGVLHLSYTNYSVGTAAAAEPGASFDYNQVFYRNKSVHALNKIHSSQQVS